MVDAKSSKPTHSSYSCSAQESSSDPQAEHLPAAPVPANPAWKTGSEVCTVPGGLIAVTFDTKKNALNFLMIKKLDCLALEKL